ncbi:MAG: DnaJ domain-containing protein [Dehalococcoidaceae bacterium]|nr:DnaJ domain-containing protein [Dehalococcoidaceae bacterium]
MNWEEACAIIGVEPGATESEIHAQYIYKAQLLHPDKTTGLPETVRQKAEDELKRINQAYAYLKTPNTNPYTCPPKISVSPSRVVFKNTSESELHTAVVRVENTGGPFTRFFMEESPAGWLKVLKAVSVTGEPLPLEITLEATGIAGSNEPVKVKLPVRLENEKTGTRDEAAIEIELSPGSALRSLQGKIFGPGLKSMFSASGSGAQPLWQKWLKTLLAVSAGLVLGLVFNRVTGMPIPLPLLLGASILFSVERWHRELTSSFKPVSALYKLGLNLAVAALIILLVWTGAGVYRQTLGVSNTTAGFIFGGEVVAFIYLLKVFSNNSWRRPKFVPTMMLALVVAVVLAFGGVEPLSSIKDSMIEAVVNLYEWIAGLFPAGA